MSAGVSPAAAKAAAPALRNAADDVRSGIWLAIAAPVASPVPSIATGRRGRSRARSMLVNTSAPPASVLTQHIGRVKGSTTTGAASTSSTVIGSRRNARGLRAAQSRCTTTTCASTSGVAPRSCRNRRAPRVSSVIGPAVPKGSSNWPGHESGDGRHAAPPWCERPLSPCATSTTSARPLAIASTARARWTRLEQPPTIVASTQRASMPSECASSVGRYGLSPAIATPSTSRAVSPQSARARRAASTASPTDDKATFPISVDSAAPTIDAVTLLLQLHSDGTPATPCRRPSRTPRRAPDRAAAHRDRARRPPGW